MIPSAAVTLVAPLVLLFAERNDDQRLRWVAKPVASTGFIAFGIACGALDSPYGMAVLVALVLSWWGDVLLIPKNDAIFKAGILAFLLGHFGFAAAFVVAGVSPVAAAVGAAVLAAPAVGIGRWIVPQAPDKLRGAVVAYIVVISVMVALGIGTVAAGNSPLLLAAAVVFYLSDLTVARERFVTAAFANRAVGLPAYYGAQLLFGWSILVQAG